MKNFELDTAVILAAGMGTRDLPASKAIPKEMSTVYDRPVVDYVVEGIARTGVKNVVFVISEERNPEGGLYQETLLREWFDPHERYEAYLNRVHKSEKLPQVQYQERGLNYTYVTQPDDGRYGTAVPLYAARHALRGAGKFLVLNGDDMMRSTDGSEPLSAFIEEVRDSGADHGLMVRPVTPISAGEYPYGIATPDADGMLIKLQEKPKASEVTGTPLANVGKYIFDETILKPLARYMRLERDQRAQDEFYLTDVVSMLDNVRVHATTAEFLDIGNANLRLLASMTMAGLSEDMIESARQQLLG